MKYNYFLIFFVFVTLKTFGAEYQTLKAGQTLATYPTSLIEITAHGTTASGSLNMILVDDSAISMPLITYNSLSTGSGSTENRAMAEDSKRGSIVTGVKSITANGTWLTVKITPAESTSPTQPNNVAVIPNDANGQFQVVLESSIDLVTWNLVYPGTFGGDTPSRFFRTRIIKLP